MVPLISFLVGEEHDRAQDQLRMRYPRYRLDKSCPLAGYCGADQADPVVGRTGLAAAYSLAKVMAVQNRNPSSNHGCFLPAKNHYRPR